MMKLSARAVGAAREPGKYNDGNGLFLNVTKNGTRSWILRVQHNGKRQDIGLGSAEHVSLKEARESASTTRELIRRGIDPVAHKRLARAAAAQPAPDAIPDFSEVAVMMHQEHSPSWRNAKHEQQWINTLRSYAFPALGDLPVNEITAPQIRDTLSVIWLEKEETARRVRQRIGAVLDYAHAKGWREHEAPMRAVSRGLPRQRRQPRHHPALPWRQVPTFVRVLRTDPGRAILRLLLEFVILTAVRSGEARKARWNELDLDRRVWTIPAERMKKDIEHVVPLSDQAMRVLAEAETLRCDTRSDAIIFPSQRTASAMSDMALSQHLRRHHEGAFTVHGFRSSFRDWVAEATQHPGEIAEMCLAHAVGSAVERAYRRSDLLERRRILMDEWGAFVAPADASANAPSQN